MTWTDDPRKADVVLVPVLSELPEYLPIARRQRVVVLFERTELVTRQWLHPDAREWTKWMGRVRALCLSADAVLAREPDVVVHAGLATNARVHGLDPAPISGRPPTHHVAERALLLGPVDSVEFLAAASAMVEELKRPCIVGQPVPQTWTPPRSSPG